MGNKSLYMLGVVSWLLAIACTAAALWLAYGIVSPARNSAAKARQELAREHAQSEAVISHALAVAMFARNYGEVQDLLARYTATGYFTRAVVTNSAQQVVASVGTTPDVAIGKPLPETIAAGGRRVKLLLRTEDYGQLVVLEAPQGDELAALEARIAKLYGTLRVLAWAALTLTLCLTLYLVWNWREGRSEVVNMS
jgi:hypothetical protein